MKHCDGHCTEYLTQTALGHVHYIPTRPVQLSSLCYRCGNMVRRDYTDHSPGDLSNCPGSNSKVVTKPTFKPEPSRIHACGTRWGLWNLLAMAQSVSTEDPTALRPTILTFQWIKNSSTTNTPGEKPYNNQNGKNPEIM